VVSTLIIAVTVPTVTYLILYFTAGSTSRASAIVTQDEEEEVWSDEDGDDNMAEPGLENGRFYAAEEVIIPAETMVIGVEVGGSFRAYLPGGMNDIDQHVLHDDFNGEPITVAYCNMSDCARVFVRGDVAADQIHMGGWNGVAMLLLIDEKRYVQSDQEMPLDEYPIKRVTWFEWKTAHPETTIYVGIGLADTQTLRDGDDELPQSAFGGH
jgi:hypothetical protein